VERGRTPGIAAAAAPWYGGFKTAVLTLLAANTVGFALFGRLSEAIDSLAWLVLLALLELETAYPHRMRERSVAALVRGGRIVAGVAVLVAAIGFAHENEWLDAVNAALWIAVVVLLEIEVRFLDVVERHRAPFAVVAGACYAGMAGLVLLWAWRGEWFDAYDALLWLVAFVTLEINVLGIARGAARGDGGATVSG
jgi:hypothetical protein